MTQPSDGSLNEFILSELLDMAAGLGALRAEYHALSTRLQVVEQKMNQQHEAGQTSTSPSPAMDIEQQLRLASRLLSLLVLLAKLAPHILVALVMGWKLIWPLLRSWLGLV